jgi:hypothetical protein
MTLSVTAALVVGCLVAWLLFPWIFNDHRDFFDCMRKARSSRSYWLRWKRPDQWAEAATADAKLLLYFILSFGSMCVTYYALRSLLGNQ